MRACRHWQWHLDEVYVRINGVTHYLGRTVDHAGEVLESIVTKTRDRKAAFEFLKKSMKRHGRPETVVTDQLLSYDARSTTDPKTRTGNVAGPAHANVADVRLSPCLGPQPLSDGRHHQDRNTFKQTRAAALTDWSGLLAV